MSTDRPDVKEPQWSSDWLEPRPRRSRPETRQPSVLRIVLIGSVGVAVLVPLFFVGMFLKPKLPPEGTRTFVGAGFQFQHPEEWRVIETVGFGPATAPGLSLQAVGIDELNAVVVSRYTVSDGSLEPVDGQIRSRVSEVLAASGSWTVQSEQAGTTMAGHPAYRWMVASLGPSGVQVASRLTVVVEGSTMFVVSCQHTVDRAAEIEAACDQVVDTLEIG